MKKLLLFALTLVLSTLLSNKAQASHAMGADISYTCISGNTYKIRLTIYRDCSGIDVTTGDGRISISSASCGVASQFITLDTVAGMWDVEVSPVCPADKYRTTCNPSGPGNLPGVKMYVFEGEYTFPQQCSDWVLSWSLCCRNGAITNLASPGSYDLYVESKLNNLTVSCNSSPIFTNLPVPFICNGQVYNYNHGAYDIDGDSLVYQNIQPLDGPSTPIAYVSGRTTASPMITSSYNFNGQTGQYVLTPSATQSAVLVVRVLEYRGGVLIGSTMRDMQLSVINCTNNQISSLASIDNFVGSGSLIDANSFEMCSGQYVSFNVTFTDPDSLNLITVLSNLTQTLPGATITTTTTQIIDHEASVTATITWTPTLADAGYHVFTLTAKDDACPVISSQTYSFDVYVYKGEGAGLDIYQCSYPDNSILKLGFSEEILCNSFDPADLQVIAPDGSTIPISSITSDCGTGTTTQYFDLNLSIPMTQTGNYEVLLVGPVRNTIASIPAFCVGLDFRDTLRFFYAPGGIIASVQALDTILCSTQYSTLIAEPVDTNQTYTYSWTGAGLLDNNIASPSVQPPSNTTTTYVVTVTDEVGCIQKDSVQISTIQSPSITITSPVSACEGDTIFLDAPSTGAVYHFWYGGGYTFSDEFIQNPYIIATTTATIHVEVGNSLDCVADSAIQVLVNPNPTPDFISDLGTICLGDTAVIKTLVPDVIPCGSTATGFACSNPGDFTLGNIASTTTTGTTGYPAPYGNYYWGARNQIIVRASELRALGMGRGYINSLSFSVASAYAGDALTDFTIKIGCTSDSVFSTNAAFLNGLMTVLNPVSYTPSLGTNTHTFNTPYFWDGTSHLVIETCFNNSAYNDNADMRYTATSYNSCIYYRSDASGVCSNTTGTTTASPNRPVMIFNGCSSGALFTNTYSISPMTGIVRTGADTYTVSPSANTLYTITGTSSYGCVGKDTVRVKVAPAYTMDAISVTGQTIVCPNDSMQISASGSIPSGSTYHWTNDGNTQNVVRDTSAVTTYALVDSVGTFYLTVTSPAGCVRKDSIDLAKLIFNINPLDSICYGSGKQITVSGATGTGASWTPATGLSDPSIPNPVASPTTSTTYVLTVNAGGCTVVDSVRANVRVVATQVSGAASICLGGSANLQVVRPAPVTYPATCRSVTAGTIPCPSPLSTWIGNSASTTSNGTSSYPAPYGNYYYGAKNQFIIRASELQAAGFQKGELNSLTFKVLNAYAGASLTNFIIKLGCTTSIQYGSTFITGLTQVYSNSSYMPVVGDNLHTFQTPYYWDGTSNLVVETCFNNTSFDENAQMAYTSTSFTSCIYYRADNSTVCGSGSNSGTSTNRPIMMFGGCSVAPPNTTYAWSGGSGIATPNAGSTTVTPTVTTTYYVDMVTKDGCNVRDSVTVEVININSINAIVNSSDTLFCEGETVQLQGINIPSGATVSWSPSAGLSNSASATPSLVTSTTTQYIMTTTATGCNKTDTVNVKVEPYKMPLLPNDTAMCESSNITLPINNYTSGSTVVWTPNANINNINSLSPTVNPSTPTTYKYVLTTPAGCVYTDSVEVSIAPDYSIAVSYKDTLLCEGQTATNFATGAPPGSTYTWILNNNTVSNDSTVTLASTDTSVYYVVSQSQLGCARVDSVLVINHTYPTTIAISTDSLCIGDDVDLSVTSPVTLTSYSWTGNNVTSGNTQSITVSPDASSYYTVVVNDGICPITDSVYVTAIALPVISLVDDTTYCTGSSVQVTATGGGNYTWTPNTAISNNTVANPVFTPSVPTTYYLNVKDAFGCESTDSISISPLALPVFGMATVDTMCQDVPYTINVSGVTSVVWDNNSTLDDTNPLAAIANPSNTTIYYATISDGTCSNRDTFTVYVDRKLYPTSFVNYSSGTDSTCQGNEVTIGVNNASIPSGSTYEWGPATGLATPYAPSTTLIANTTQTYNLLITKNPTGCIEEVSVTVKVVGAAVLVSGPDSLCFGQSARLLAQGGTGIYTWEPATGVSDPNVSNPTISPITTTTYVATSDFGSCVRRDTITVFVAREIKPAVTTDPEKLEGQAPFTVKFNNSTTGANSYLWSFGELGKTSTELNPTYTYETMGEYIVQMVAYGDYNCSDTIEIGPITIAGFMIPNIITPNGDNTNDAFVINGLEKNTQLRIVNRWGVVMYSTDNYDNSWKAEGVSEGVYYYEITFPTAGFHKGWLQVIK